MSMSVKAWKGLSVKSRRLRFRFNALSVQQSLPFDDRARPGQSAAEHDHQNVIAVFDPAGAIRFVERDGDRGGRRVAVLVEIHKESIERNFQSIGDRFDDAEIGLVRNDAGDVVGRQAGLLERFLGRVHHRDDRLLVNFLARHVDRVADSCPRFRA